MQNYRLPEYHATSFNCPFCGVFARQVWYIVVGEDRGAHVKLKLLNTYPKHSEIAHCEHCDQFSFWVKERMIYPTSGPASLPHNDMPEDVKTDYIEARNIVSFSPRSAAALLRLAVQKLTNNILGTASDSNLNDNIKKLVENGLPRNLQQALDIVRVTGNHSVHPGEIDLKDDQATATRLFELVNIITQSMITTPKEIDQLYKKLPEKDKENIAKRDNKPTEKQ